MQTLLLYVGWGGRNRCDYRVDEHGRQRWFRSGYQGFYWLYQDLILTFSCEAHKNQERSYQVMLPGFKDPRALVWSVSNLNKTLWRKQLRIKSGSISCGHSAAVFSCVNFKTFACRRIPLPIVYSQQRYLFDSPSSLSALSIPAKSTSSVPACRRSPNTQRSPSPPPSASSELLCSQSLPPVRVTYRRLCCHECQWSQKHSCGSNLRREE